jgi:hypothetical protein
MGYGGGGGDGGGGWRFGSKGPPLQRRPLSAPAPTRLAGCHLGTKGSRGRPMNCMRLRYALQCGCARRHRSAEQQQHFFRLPARARVAAVSSRRDTPRGAGEVPRVKCGTAEEGVRSLATAWRGELARNFGAGRKVVGAGAGEGLAENTGDVRVGRMPAESVRAGEALAGGGLTSRGRAIRARRCGRGGGRAGRSPRPPACGSRRSAGRR